MLVSKLKQFWLPKFNQIHAKHMAKQRKLDNFSIDNNYSSLSWQNFFRNCLGVEQCVLVIRVELEGSYLENPETCMRLFNPDQPQLQV